MIKRVFGIVCITLLIASPGLKAQPGKMNKTDSLLSIVVPDPRDTVAINTIICLVDNLAREGKFDEALKYSILARSSAEKIYYKKGIARSLMVSGYTYKLKGAYQAAIGDLEEAERIFKEVNDLVGLGRVYNNIGHTYEDMSEFLKGLEYHQLALDFFSRAGYELLTCCLLC